MTTAADVPRETLRQPVEVAVPILKRSSGRRSSMTDIPSRETNQLVIVLAEAAVAVLERRREAEERPDTAGSPATTSPA